MTGILSFMFQYFISSEKVLYTRITVMKEVLNLSKCHWYHDSKFLIHHQMTSLQLHWKGQEQEQRLAQKITGSHVNKWSFTTIIDGGTL